MFKLKVYAFIVLLMVVIAAAFFFAPGIGGIFNRTPETKVSVHTVARRYLENAQMISLHCKYDDVFELAEDKLKNIYGLPIPGTEKHVIIKTQGTIFLGIDCKEITVDTTRSDTLFMTFPPVKIIAHEFEFTNIYDMSGIFRKYNLKELPELRSNYKKEIEYYTKNDWAAISMAETAMEKAFKNDIPALKDVPIVFFWTPTTENISIGIKRETPVKMSLNLQERAENP